MNDGRWRRDLESRISGLNIVVNNETLRKREKKCLRHMYGGYVCKDKVLVVHILHHGHSRTNLYIDNLVGSSGAETMKEDSRVKAVLTH